MRCHLLSTTLLAIAISTFAQEISIDGNCSTNSNINATCLGSSFGDCCSANGFCGSTDVYCGAGCQETSGNCAANASLISVDGRCGRQDPGTHICPQSIFGPCCSVNGFCGSNSTYCGTGCQSDFGECDVDTATSTTSSVTTSATSEPTTTAATSSGSRTTESTGFKVGMAFVGIAVAGVIGGLLFFFIRRKRRSMGEQEPGVFALEKGTDDNTKALPPPPPVTEPQELNSSPVQELSTDYNQARDEKKPLRNDLHELQ